MHFVRIAAAALAIGLAAPASGASLDAAAERFVRLTLEYGAHEDGYVDAYFGPPEWREAAEADPRSLSRLLADTRKLEREVRSLAYPSDPLEQQRHRFMIAQLGALETRILMRQGEEFAFAEEAERLFGARPDLQPLGSFEPILKRIESLVPGEGPLNERVKAYRDRFLIPEDRLDAVMRAAMDECRARTAAHIDLPENERFALSFVTDKPWSGYNWYEGDSASRIEVNTDLPINISRAVDLGCHEGYPGHHTLNLLVERELAEKRRWIEFTVNPLFSPQSLISEGTANAGIEMAFPGEARTAFEAEVLYPLAGLDPETADELTALNEAVRDLYPAQYTIADAYMAGRMSRGDAIDALARYTLVSKDRAAQRIDFIDTYGSYIINYALGRDMVEAYVERASGDDEAARWAVFEWLISTPSLPSDLLQ